MGFGLLFLGYLIEYIFELNHYGAFVYLLGYGLMYMGLMRLRLYCHNFRFAQWTVIPLALISAYRTLSFVSTEFSLSFIFVTELADQISYWANFALVLLFHVLLAIAIKEIAIKTGVQKNAVAALRNLVAVTLYSATMLAMAITPSLAQYLYAVSLILRLAWSILNCWLIYSCYMRICPADEAQGDDVLQRPSRFAFVNRFRAEFKRREDKAIAEDRAYHAENARKRLEKRQNSGQKRGSKAAKREEIKAARDAARHRDD